MKTRRFCPYCGRPVLKSIIDGYSFQCYACDEDFYRFEVFSTKEIAQVKAIRKSEYDYVKTRGNFIPSFNKPYTKFN